LRLAEANPTFKYHYLLGCFSQPNLRDYTLPLSPEEFASRTFPESV
jgi:hypothetical protein